MRKNRILAVICSLIFAMNCSACKGAEQEILLIGQQDAAQASLSTGRKEEMRENIPDGRQEVESSCSGQWTEQGQTPQKETDREICVYVCGAVAAPGVVFLPDGSRAADALEAAGGFAPEAAEEAVNLAARVSDGEKLFFPSREEYEAQAEAAEEAAAGLVNINTADIAQLCTLPGIGESRAADIIAYREAAGGFAACEDIMQVPGIKGSVYSKISSKITVK